jgi:hypothetical protein
VEAGSSFEDIEEDQGIITIRSTDSEEATAPPEEQGNPRQVPNVPQPEPEPSPVAPTQQNPPKMSKEAPEPEPFMPKAPKMGRLVQVSATMYVAELGNVPNPDFSGLLDEGKGQYV